jgi:hypothetical protein
MIRHDPITLTSVDEPVIFASLFDISCSICAPGGMTKDQIEAYANENGPKSLLGPWRVFDVAIITRTKSHTPHQCNQVDDRVHWFLLSEHMVKRANQ